LKWQNKCEWLIWIQGRPMNSVADLWVTSFSSNVAHSNFPSCRVGTRQSQHIFNKFQLSKVPR
jgi:hypothetical protein